MNIYAHLYICAYIYIYIHTFPGLAIVNPNKPQLLWDTHYHFFNKKSSLKVENITATSHQLVAPATSKFSQVGSPNPQFGHGLWMQYKERKKKWASYPTCDRHIFLEFVTTYWKKQPGQCHCSPILFFEAVSLQTPPPPTLGLYFTPSTKKNIDFLHFGSELCRLRLESILPTMYIYIHIYVYIYTYVYIYIRSRTHIHHVYTCTCTYICVLYNIYIYVWHTIRFVRFQMGSYRVDSVPTGKRPHRKILSYLQIGHWKKCV